MSGAEKMEYISIHNAYEHNLKNIDLDISLEKFTCITGPSGCGKSSLVFDTIYAESQRAFLESMSGNLFGQKLMDKPKVDLIENLKPALNVSQSYYNVNPRSTIGTVSDVSYYLRALFALLYSQETGHKVDINYFSPNNPSSCCPKCGGTGMEYIVSEENLIPDKNKSLSAGGILFFKGKKNSREYKLLEAMCDYYGINIDKKVSELTAAELDNLLHNPTPIEFVLKYRTPKGRYKTETVLSAGAIIELNSLLERIDIPSTFQSISKYLEQTECSACSGKKLRSDILAYKVCGMNIADVEALQLNDVRKWISNVLSEYADKSYKEQILQLTEDINCRIDKMISLSLGYLSLGRSIPSLSGGEVQRVRIANQLNCPLNGLLYILDEPCKGLHFKNTESIIAATRELVKKGNTVISIEHNKKYISNADQIVELGPSGGKAGGYLISQHEPDVQYRQIIEYRKPRKRSGFIQVRDICYHNLKHISVDIPQSSISCITGVSGSGKSSLVSVIADSCSQKKAVHCGEINLSKKLRSVVKVNQQPIGKNSRSTVLTYLGVSDAIRDVFAETDSAKGKGLGSSDFSMNKPGGRCEKCQGTGKIEIDLKYLPESYIECPVCKGKRFQERVLEVTFNGYTINDVLDTPVEEIKDAFKMNNAIYGMLLCMEKLGLGYISLGQASMTLSGGEAQRVKLAKALGTKSTGNGLYLLDEPTSGLSESDIERLKAVLNELADGKNTVILIEHNLEFITAISDYMIDLGSVAGNEGGTTVIQGDPEKVVSDKSSSWQESPLFLLANNKTIH